MLTAVLLLGDVFPAEAQVILQPIVFSSERDGNRELYLTGPTDSAATRATNTASESEVSPEWSPDGTRIAYGGNTLTFTSDPDGGNRDGPLGVAVDRAGDPAWSPDGLQLAVQVSENFAGGDDWEIYLMNPDGTGLSQLTNNSAQDRYPHWSPDGTSIVIARDDIITIIDATTGADIDSFPTAGTARYPAWSPDGTKIAYSRAAAGWNLAVLDIASGISTNIVADGAYNWHPSWSPDGTQLVFATTPSLGSDDFDLAIVDADGTGRTLLPSNSASNDFYPHWYPGAAAAIQADLAVGLSADTTSVTPGRPATIRTTVTNNGPDDATGVVAAITVTPTDADVAPLDATCAAGALPATLDCDLGAIAAGAAPQFGFTVSPQGEGLFDVDVAVLGNEDDPDAANNGANVEINSSNTPSSADLVTALNLIDGEVDENGRVLVGDILVYAATVRNDGPDSAPNTELTVDVQPSSAALIEDDDRCTLTSVIRCDLSDLADGAEAEVRFGVRPSEVSGHTVTAAAIAGVADPNPADNEATAEFESRNPSADLSVESRVLIGDEDGDGEVPVGHEVVIQAQVRNNGPEDAAGVLLSFQLPPTGVRFIETDVPGCTPNGALIECPLGALRNGGVLTVDLTVQYSEVSYPDTAVVEAQVDGDLEDPAPGNNLSLMPIEVHAPEEADAGVSFLGVWRNDWPVDLPYQLEANVTGQPFSGSISGIRLTVITDNGYLLPVDPRCEQFPDPTALLCLAPNLRTDNGFEFDAILEHPGDAVITALVDSLETDTDPTNDSDTFSFYDIRPQRADMSVRILHGRDPSDLIRGLQYDISPILENLTGPEAAGQASLHVDLPPGMILSGINEECVSTDGDLECSHNFAPGTTQKVLFSFTTQYTQTGQFSIDASVSGTQLPDPNPDNDSASQPIVVREASADLLVQISSPDLPNPLLPGDEFEMNVRAFNGGPDAAHDFEVKVVLPQDATVDPGFQCESGNEPNEFLCSNFSMRLDSFDDIEYSFDVQFSTTGTKALTASATALGVDPDPGRATDTKQVEVEPFGLTLRAMEVNQSAQNWMNHVRLIEGKDTIVRVFLEGGDGSRVGGLLHGSRGGVTLSGSPLRPLNSGQVILPPDFAEDHRHEENSSLNFKLPSSWTAGDVALDFELVASDLLDLICAEPQSFPDPANDCASVARFEPVSNPPYVFVGMGWDAEDGQYMAPPSEAVMIEQIHRSRAMHPVADFDWEIKWLVNAGELQSRLDETQQPTTLAALELLDLGRIEAGSQAHHYAVLDGLADDAWGRAYAPGKAAVGFLGDSAPVSSTSQRRNTIGQETLHNLGLRHAVDPSLGLTDDNQSQGHCGSTAPENARPHDWFGPLSDEAGGRIVPLLGPDDEGPDLEIWGVDPRYFPGNHHGLGIISPHATADVMGYCHGPGAQDTWVSRSTYRRAYVYWANVPQPVGNASSAYQQPVTEVLYVSGELRDDGVSINPAQTFPGTAQTASASEFTIALLNPAGEVTSQQPIQIDTLDSHGQEGDHIPDRQIFSAVLAKPAAALSAIEARHLGQVIGSLTFGPAIPEVEILSPEGGETFGAGSVDVAWNAFDADSDPLEYTIHYSTDDGANWSLVAAGLHEEQVDLPVHLLAGSDSARVRVMASDGGNVGMAVSEVFQVANKPPTLVLATPIDGAVLGYGPRIPVEAVAYDVEDGPLGDDAIGWSVHGGAHLGTGSQFELDTITLGVGEHRINVIAEDSAGLFDQLSFTVEVQPIGLAGDFDNDGLENDGEALFGTDPYKPDSDGDGFNDGIDPDSLMQFLEKLGDDVFKAPGHRVALMAHMATLQKQMGQENPEPALATLQVLMKRLDGCSSSSVPDSDDWVMECIEQMQIMQHLERIEAYETS